MLINVLQGFEFVNPCEHALWILMGFYLVWSGVRQCLKLQQADVYDRIVHKYVRYTHKHALNFYVCMCKCVSVHSLRHTSMRMETSVSDICHKSQILRDDPSCRRKPSLVEPCGLSFVVIALVRPHRKVQNSWQFCGHATCWTTHATSQVSDGFGVRTLLKVSHVLYRAVMTHKRSLTFYKF